MGGALDVDSGGGRTPRSHGAVRLPSRSAGSLSGCKLRLAEILRQPGAGARRRCGMNASDSMMDSYRMKVSGKMKASGWLVAGFWIFPAPFSLAVTFTPYYHLPTRP